MVEGPLREGAGAVKSVVISEDLILGTFAPDRARVIRAAPTRVAVMTRRSPIDRVDRRQGDASIREKQLPDQPRSS
jgi:hypothetical protein